MRWMIYKFNKQTKGEVEIARSYAPKRRTSTLLSAVLHHQQKIRYSRRPLRAEDAGIPAECQEA